jgi:hypothetical protein
MFRNIIIFYGKQLLAPRPTPQAGGPPLVAVRDCLLNVFAATFHNSRPFLHPKPEDAPCRGGGVQANLTAPFWPKHPQLDQTTVSTNSMYCNKTNRYKTNKANKVKF